MPKCCTVVRIVNEEMIGKGYEGQSSIDFCQPKRPGTKEKEELKPNDYLERINHVLIREKMV